MMNLPGRSSFGLVLFSTSTNAMGIWTRQSPFASANKNRYFRCVGIPVPQIFSRVYVEGDQNTAACRKTDIVFSDYHSVAEPASSSTLDAIFIFRGSLEPRLVTHRPYCTMEATSWGPSGGPTPEWSYSICEYTNETVIRTTKIPSTMTILLDCRSDSHQALNLCLSNNRKKRANWPMVRGGAQGRAKMYRRRENFLTLVKRGSGMPVVSVGEGVGCRLASSEASGFRRGGRLMEQAASS
jgi:hypothetical protein